MTDESLTQSEIVSRGLTKVLTSLRDEISTEEMTDEEKADLDDLDEVIQDTGDIFSMIGEMRDAGGPTSYMGLVRLYMQKYKLGVKRVALATGIDPRRLKGLLDERDGPVPGEMSALSQYMLPKILNDKSHVKDKAPSFLEKKRAAKRKRLADKENRKYPRPAVSEII